MAGPIENFDPAAGANKLRRANPRAFSTGSLNASDYTAENLLVGARWGMADVSSAPGSKLVLEGPLTDEWTDRTYRAATYPRHGGDVIDEAFGEWPEEALLNLLTQRRS